MSCCAEQCIQYSGLDDGPAGMLYTYSAPITHACLNWSGVATACNFSGSSRRPCKQGVAEYNGRCLGEIHTLHFGVHVTLHCSADVQSHWKVLSQSCASSIADWLHESALQRIVANINSTYVMAAQGHGKAHNDAICP